MTNENVVPFQTQASALTAAVNKGIQGVLKADEIILPTKDDTLVNNYIRKIEGDYDLSHSKHDTDNAIDLIYIAYNAVPPEMAQGRVGLTKLQQSLLQAQKKAVGSVTAKGTTGLSGAAHIAELIVKQIANTYPIWRDDILQGQSIAELAENSESIADFKDFLKNDMIPLTKYIQDKSTEIAKNLDSISEDYSALGKEAQEVSIRTQESLASEINRRNDLKDSIAEMESNKESITAIQANLVAELLELKELNEAYEKRAKSAENKAFITGLTGAIIGGLAGLVPVAVMCANPVLGMTMQAAKSATQVSSSGASSAKDEAQSINTAKQQKAIADKASNGQEQNLVSTDIKEKELEKKALEEEVQTNTDLSTEEIKAKNKLIDQIVLEIDKLKVRQASLVEAYKILDATLSGLKNDLKALSAEERSVAATLYEKQDNILAMISNLHKEERKQIGELAKLEKLLGHAKDKEKDVDISVFSLNLSIQAIMKCKEIIETISMFFKHFASFMIEIREEAEMAINNFERFEASDRVRSGLFNRTVETLNNVFIDQTARWLASQDICEQFTANFTDGFSKLNKLSGTYITSDKRAEYLTTAKDRLNEIISEREKIQNEQDASHKKAESEKVKKAS